MIEFGEFQITKREILVSLAILFIGLALGFCISTGIADSVDAANEKYFKSLKINDNAEMFNYGFDTKVGYMLSTGVAKVVDPVSISDIEGQYAEIRKVEEEYTRHTRQVQKSKIVNGETVYYYETEVYYTWDWEDEWNWKSTRFVFLKKDFDYKYLDPYTHQREFKTIKRDSDTRFVYYVAPTEYYGSMFLNAQGNSFYEFQFFNGSSYENVIAIKETEGASSASVFWIFWIILLFFGICFYVFLDNHYLEDRGHQYD